MQAVDFINNKLQYRFIDLDISVTLTFEDSDFLFIPGFQSTNSIAHISVPRELFAALFYYSIQYVDMNNNDYTKMKYAMDASGWYDAPYSNAIVDASYQINSNTLFQNVKYDYIRYVLKQITGNNASNGLFRNTDTLLNTVISMDTPFNSQILTILATCGTVDSPKDGTTFYNNPGRVLIDSILANDNVIETDNVERRAALLSNISTNVTTDYNQNKSYYVVGTKTDDTIQYCYFPIYINAAIASTQITFKEYPGYTFYTTASPAKYTNFETVANAQYYVKVGINYFYPLYLKKIDNAVTYTEHTYTGYSNITFYSTGVLTSTSVPSYPNIDSIDTAYYINATKFGTKVRFPIYIKDTSPSSRQAITGKFAEYPNISFYTSYTVYNNSFNLTDASGTYLNATRTGTIIKQDYRVYMNNNTAKNPVTFLEYPGTTFYTDCRNYDSLPGWILAIKTGDFAPDKYYVVSDVSSNTYSIAITFTTYPGTFYTNTLTGSGSIPNFRPYDGFYLYATPMNSTSTQYYPVYLKSTGVYNTEIKFVEYSGTYYTDYINYNSDTAYYVFAKFSSTIQRTNYYPIYLNSTPAHSQQVNFDLTDVSLNGITFYTSSSLTFSTAAPENYLNIDTPLYFLDSTKNYNYPVYVTNNSSHSTQAGTLTLYQGTTLFVSSYDNFAFTNYNPTVPYYITGTKTGTLVTDTYFPIYVNYPKHSCSTPITFTDPTYSGFTFYTDYEEANDTFHPFTFEYGDSLSVRVTYKPKYNTYLGREIKDYSYQIYLDMGIEENTTRPYTLTGDENPTGAVVGQITRYDSAIYTSLGTNKIFHYVLQNASLPDLYTSPYNFYPTLNDISNVSFDVSSNVTGRWFFSVFCRPRTTGEYDSIGFDRFDTENVALNTWTSYNINTLKWTNGTTGNLTWKNVLELPFEAITTPYGNIKSNSQQQIMVMAISTDTAAYGGSIRNVSVVFNDGRTITLV
jgi:hypothetical protein